MKTLLLVSFLLSASGFAAGPVDSDKVNHELFGAVVALGLPACDEYNKYSCSTTVKDLYCKTVGGLHELKDGTYLAASDYRCSYVVSDPVNPENQKTVGVSGSKSEALFIALQHAKLKLDCDRTSTVEESSCNTRMQNIKCGEGAVQGSVKYSCEVDPKYLLVQTHSSYRHDGDAAVINAKTRKASRNGCNGDWVCDRVTKLGGGTEPDFTVPGK